MPAVGSLSESGCVMITVGRLGLLLLMLAVLASGVACQGTPTGPSLANMAVSGLTWQPTMAIEGAADVCCCHLRGQTTNRNSVAVHATLTVRTYKQQQELPAVVFIMKDIPPGGVRPFDIAGFVVPCGEITGWNYELEVKGIAYPPL